MHSLPLFHRTAGRPVIVLGTGEAAQAKRRLVERAGGQVISDSAAGMNAGARLAFVAHEDALLALEQAEILRAAGLLVNVVDRPDACDFTTPSLLDRDPVLIAVGTGGASAGFAKILRLRLERVLPATLGALALALKNARGRVRARWPDPDQRRHALDQALDEGGLLDLADEAAHTRIDAWLDGADIVENKRYIRIMLTSMDPEDLTLREARLLGSADVIWHDARVPAAILARARADAMRITQPAPLPDLSGHQLVVELNLP